MRFVADLHIHSHFSRATSKDLNLESLYRWAQFKGLQVVGTGDISHPGWLEEMTPRLAPAEDGLFRLRDEYADPLKEQIGLACRGPVRFMLTGEISNIYKKNGKVRKIHNVVCLPHFDAARRFQAALEKVGNIRSDGRPILGLDARDLLEIVLESDPQSYLIPAHIWTPWFSLFGAKSGFDAIEECFEDLTPHIFALETGLSSDPPMNWRLSALDGYTLVSSSDAHSPGKLAREANRFDTELSYPAIFQALKTGDPTAFLGTVEFFAEEGKYHYDGHRKCGIRWDPETTKKHGGVCPKCGKGVTVGVMHRVDELADRREGERPRRRHPFKSLIPLPEVLAEVHRVDAASRQVQKTYSRLLDQLGSELSILEEQPLEDIERAGGPLLAEGIRRMRRGEVAIAAGYDGEYGTIQLFDSEDRSAFSPQSDLFAWREPAPADRSDHPAPSRPLEGRSERPPGQEALLDAAQVAADDGRKAPQDEPSALPFRTRAEDLLEGLNPEQKQCVLCTRAHLVIIAGPGTGKTRTLTRRVAHLIAGEGTRPEDHLAITFTNKAAEEMRERLSALLGRETTERIAIRTFHAFGAMLLQSEFAREADGIDPELSICGEGDRQRLLRSVCPQLSAAEVDRSLQRISNVKSRICARDARAESDLQDPTFAARLHGYEKALRESRLLDFDDLIVKSVELLDQNPEAADHFRSRFRWISVDEFQDIDPAQYRLLKLVAGQDANLCAIGDPDQAIYGFRGADRERFLALEQDFPGAETVRLVRNYRSIQPILEAAAQVIERSPGRLPGSIRSHRESSERIEVHRASSDKSEAEIIVRRIEAMMGGLSHYSFDSGRVDGNEAAERPFAAFAVLFRLAAQSRALEEAMGRAGIPYQVVGQKPICEFKEIERILAALRYLYDRNRGERRLRFEEASRSVPKRTRSLLDAAVSERQGRTVAAWIERIQESLIGDSSQELTPQAQQRCQRLLLMAAPFDTRLDDFLEAVLLQGEADAYDPRADRVTLMTMHASKGLEFPVVFVCGCEEDIVPYRREGAEFDLDEERRLFYVGMTRARDRLVLTSAKRRTIFGRTQDSRPSRFLDDIDESLKRIQQRRSPAPIAEAGGQPAQLALF